MELYRTRYDGSDAVAVYIQQVLQLVESEKLRITLHGDKSGKLEHLFFRMFSGGQSQADQRRYSFWQIPWISSVQRKLKTGVIYLSDTRASIFVSP